MTTALGHYLSPNYRDAVQELRSIMDKHGRMLLLIDSIEKYEFHDTITLAVLNALATQCVDFSRDKKGIILKMAAPSELIPKLSSVNFEKISSKIVYINKI